eukprot:TRINITY_DN14656_c0_g1_i1.p1 TRINITY_DN14656_c0_g1~~TRINITY_DN14656_c0_g1_i1.p1  ORF type:complete len:627 (+),score=206.45 TRINITY_DN14656_c0_g1_i1:112-1992(+)
MLHDEEMHDLMTDDTRWSAKSCEEDASQSDTPHPMKDTFRNPLQETLHVVLDVVEEEDPTATEEVSPQQRSHSPHQPAPHHGSHGSRSHHQLASQDTPVGVPSVRFGEGAEDRKQSFVDMTRFRSDGFKNLPTLQPSVILPSSMRSPLHGAAAAPNGAPAVHTHSAHTAPAEEHRLPGDDNNSETSRELAKEGSMRSWRKNYGYESDEDDGEDYNSRTQMIALESMAPKVSSHIWVVQQNTDGTVEVFTPNNFEDFLRLATPHLYRDQFRDNQPRHKVGKHGSLPHIWVDFQGLNSDEIRELGQILVLHELTVEDMITSECPEKLEVFEDLEYHYAMLHGFWPDTSSGSGWKEASVSCVLLYNFFVTIHSRPFVGLDEMLRRARKDFVMTEAKRRRLERNAYSVDPNAQRLRKMKGLWLFYCLFDILVDALIPRVSHIWDHANQVDELILQLWGSKEPEMDDTTRIMARTRKHINDLRRSVTAKEWIIKENRLYNQPHYRDVMDHVQQMLYRLDSARDVVAQANSNYLAGVSVQAAIGANSTNEVMKRMSVFAFAFAPMTLITSMFGMNVKVPFQDDGTLPFWMILVCMFVPVIITFLVFTYCQKRKRARKRRERQELISFDESSR